MIRCVGKPGNPPGPGPGDRRFKSDRADSHCGGARAGTSRRLLTVSTQVRFLSPQLFWKDKPIGDGCRLESGRACKCLEGSTPSPSALKHDVPLAERQRRQPSKLDRWVQLPQGILGDRLTVGCLPLKQVMEVQILLPEPFGDPEAQIAVNTAGWLLLVATPGSDPGGRWFDSNPRNFFVAE